MSPNNYSFPPTCSLGHLDALLRGLVLGKLGKAGHKATLEEARRRFKDHVEGKHMLSADLRSPVGYCKFWFPKDCPHSLSTVCTELLYFQE